MCTYFPRCCLSSADHSPHRPATLLILRSSCRCGMNLQRRGRMWLKKTQQKHRHTHMDRLSIKSAQRFISPGEICDSAAFRCSDFRYCLEWLYSEVTGGNPSPPLYTCQAADLVLLTQTSQHFAPHYSCQMCIKQSVYTIEFQLCSCVWCVPVL